MSTNDKTGEKLLASMRKTKADAADKSGAEKAENQAASKQEAPSSPPPKKKAPAKRGGRGRTSGGDPYQSGRRIWPD